MAKITVQQRVQDIAIINNGLCIPSNYPFSYKKVYNYNQGWVEKNDVLTFCLLLLFSRSPIEEEAMIVINNNCKIIYKIPQLVEGGWPCCWGHQGHRQKPSAWQHAHSQGTGPPAWPLQSRQQLALPTAPPLHPSCEHQLPPSMNNYTMYIKEVTDCLCVHTPLVDIADCALQ